MKATFNNTQIAQFYKKENKTNLSAKIIRDIIYSYFDLITNDIAAGKRVTLAYLEDIEEKIDKAISLKEQEIEKLKEYKTVLNDKVVTGKVKIN